mgnify:CR=1 FL=1
MKIKISTLKNLIQEAIATRVRILVNDDGTKTIVSPDMGRKYADASGWKLDDFKQFLGKRAIDYVEVKPGGYKKIRNFVPEGEFSRRKFLKKLADLNKPKAEYPPHKVINTLSHQRHAPQQINFPELRRFIGKVLSETPSSAAFDTSTPNNLIGAIQAGDADAQKYAIYITQKDDGYFQARNTAGETIASGKSEKEVADKAIKANYKYLRRSPHMTQTAFYDELSGMLG